MHVLGFWHEHSRSDRGDYIDIHWGNIHPLEVNNFLIVRINNADYLVSCTGIKIRFIIVEKDITVKLLTIILQ